MSFPRAKIQRFNEIKDSTPSPADYNVKLKDKTKATVISQTERFADLKSPSTSESGSVLSVPCFRTPTKINVPKKKLIHSDTKPKLKLKDLFINQKDLQLELLSEKIVECENKDSCIRDLTEQLECLKNNIAELEYQKSIVESERNSYKSQLEDMVTVHQETLRELRTSHDDELKNISVQILQSKHELETILKEYSELKTQDRQDIVALSKNIDKLENIYKISLEDIKSLLEQKEKEIFNKERELNLLQESCLDIQKKHDNEIKTLKASQTEELLCLKNIIVEGLNIQEEQLEYLFNDKKIIIKDIIQCIENEYNKIINEMNNKLKIEEDKTNCLVESENKLRNKLEELEVVYKSKLVEQEKQHEQILKECQAISEYNIIQSEVEKNDCIKRLATTELELDELNEKYKAISTKYNDLTESYKRLENQVKKLVVELKETHEKTTKKIGDCDLQINNLLTEKHTFSITIVTLQDTIHVLTKRLIESDRDVEQLKSELTSCESKLLECEDTCNKLTSEQQRMKNAMEELEMQNESTFKIAATDVKKVENNLLKKLNDYKKISESEIKLLKRQLDQKQRDYNEAMKQLEQNQMLNEECEILVKRVEDHFDEVEVENIELKRQLEKLEIINEDLITKIKEYTEEINKYHEVENELTVKSEKISRLLQEIALRDDDIESLKKELQQVKEKSQLISECCDYYKCKTADYETEIEEASQIRKRYIEQSGKYDELLQEVENLQTESCNQKKVIKEQELLIGPFREQLEKYETEHMALVNEKHYIESEAKELGHKYAEILGHQNHKQKIKHLVDLKVKNDELLKSKLELESKVRCHSKTIEKLKKENSDLRKTVKRLKPVDDKENTSSPNRSMNGNKVESPGPLRDRN